MYSEELKCAAHREKYVKCKIEEEDKCERKIFLTDELVIGLTPQGKRCGSIPYGPHRKHAIEGKWETEGTLMTDRRFPPLSFMEINEPLLNGGRNKLGRWS